MILQFFVKNGITKTALAGLLKMMAILLPQPNNVPATQYYFDKFLAETTPSFGETIVKHQLCETCGYYLGEFSVDQENASCGACGSEGTKGIFVECNLRSLLIDAFENRKLYELIEEHNEAAINDNDDIFNDITSGQQYKKLERECDLNEYDVVLIWGTDGAPMTDSSNGQLWAVQLQILNIPPKSRVSFQLVVGLYYSYEQKPKSNEFLKPFIKTMQSLLSDGFEWQHPTKGKMKSKAIAPVATMDAPAKALVLNMMGHCGQYSCSYCEHPGETGPVGRGHNHVFSFENDDFPLRTDESMTQQSMHAIAKRVQHVKGMKGLSNVVGLPYCDLANSFPPEYMHNLLGLFKLLLNCWTDSKNCHKDYYLSKSVRAEIDRLITETRSPNTIPREPRPLKSKPFYKASEIQSLCLFILPVILKGKLAETYYQHFLLLVKISYLCLQSEITTEEIDMLEDYVKIFCQDFQRLYGLEKCTLIPHHLIHLPHFIRLWGPAWAWSAFPFEDENGILKKFNHCPNKVNIEIANTLRYYNAMFILGNLLRVRSPPKNILIPLGAPVKHIEITQSVLIALSHQITTPIHVVETQINAVYSHVMIKSAVFTSELYHREKKRCNSCIAWGCPRLFGIIKFFVKCDNSLYAITRELLPYELAQDKAIYHDLNIPFSDSFQPVQESNRIHAIPVDDIEEKIMRVDNYVCRPQSIVMRC